MNDFRFTPLAGVPARITLQLLVALTLTGASPQAAQPAGAELSLSAAQITALGIETISPQAAQSSELQGLAAQVVVPPAQQTVLSAPLAGLVEQVLVATQEPVRKGQPLVRIQSPTLAEAQKGYLQALTEAALARSQLDRDERLLREGIIAESRVQVTRSRWADAAAAQAERVQALHLAGLDDQALRRLREGRRLDTLMTLRSPIDGVVLEQMVVTGQRLEAATALLRIARLDPLWIEVQVPVARLAAVHDGAIVRTANGTRARVISIGRNVHAASQTALVRAQTLPGGPPLLAGEALEVVLEAQTKGMLVGRQWRVPNAALLRLGSSISVFVRTAGGYRLTPVKLLAEGQQDSLVEAPFKTGEGVVVKGVAALKATLAGKETP